MSSEGPSIIWLQEVTREQRSQVGEKALNMGLVLQEGYPVPACFAIPARAWQSFLEDTKLGTDLPELLARDRPAEALAREIQSRITGTTIPEDVAGPIMDAYHELVEGRAENVHVAVRTSLVANDETGVEDYLGSADLISVVDEDGLLTAVKKCWATRFSARMIEYHREHDIEPGTKKKQTGLVAVIVQFFVPCRVSGVMFTQVPGQALGTLVIEAGWGNGKALVRGKVTPDRFWVTITSEASPSYKILHRAIATQERQLAWNPDECQFEEIPVPAENRSQQKLPDAQIKALAQVGVELTSFFHEAQNVEWCAGDGIHVLESRPLAQDRAPTKPREDTGEPGRKTERKGRATSKNHPDAQEVLLEGTPASRGIAAGIVRHVKGGKPPSGEDVPPKEERPVIVTEEIDPDLILSMDEAAAIVTDRGGTTSHAAVISRELGIPCVVGAGNATEVLEEGSTVTVDGSSGEIFAGRLESREQGGNQAPESSTGAFPTEGTRGDEGRTPVQTQAPTGTKILVNLSTPGAAKRAAQLPVAGVGLMRGEFVAGQLKVHPQQAVEDGKGAQWSEELAKQLELVARAFAPRPVVYRTLDFKSNEFRNLEGGDREPEENNPMLGFRGCFRNISQEEVFGLELQALRDVREAGHSNLHVMFPFVRRITELRAAIALLEEHGLPRGRDFEVWIMVEVPSVVLRIDEFLEDIDGVSLGTNDLTQLVLGVDRDNPRLSEIYDARDPAVLQCMKTVISACRARGIPVSSCGAAAVEHEEIVDFLVECGITSISVTPDAVERTWRRVARAERRLLLDRHRHDMKNSGEG